MKISFLFSSSEGNSTLIESETGVTILIDAGVSYKKLKEAYGDDLFPNALFITHEHSDHIAGAGVLGRKSQCPIFIPEKSFYHAKSTFKNCALITLITGGQTVLVGDLEVTSFSTQHDAKESVGYIVKEGDKKFGYITDTGNISKLMRSKLEGCNAYFLEADYEEADLWDYDDYTVLLKERIASPFGHLSNDQALDFIDTLDLDNIDWVALGHLSRHTNSVDLVRRKYIARFPGHIDKLYIAPQQEKLLI